MFGRNKHSQEPKFNKKTEEEVNKIVPSGKHEEDHLIDFRPLWDEPRDSWDRLVKANPQQVADDATPHPDDSLLAAILEGKTSSEILITQPQPPDQEDDTADVAGEESVVDEEAPAPADTASEPTDSEAPASEPEEVQDPAEIPTVEPSLAYSDMDETEEEPEPTVVHDESPLAKVAKPAVIEAPDVQEKLDAEAAAVDATTSQNYIISMAAQRERREEKKRNTMPIFLGIGAAIGVVALLAGLGFAFPAKHLPRAEAQSTLRNAGAEALNKAPMLEQLPPMALIVQERTVTRAYKNDGISYAVTTTEKMVIGDTTVDTDTLESDVTFTTPQDRARWEKADKPELPGMQSTRRRPGSRQVRISTTTINLDALASWPRDIDGLTRTLAKAIPGVQPVRSAMLLASVPGLDRAFYHGLFGVMARNSEAHIVDTPAGIAKDVPEGVKTVQFPANATSPTTATITFDPNTGQVYAVVDATREEKLVLVRATGFLNCVDTAGPKGPRNINMGCSMGALYLQDLSWRGWGSPKAVAEGTTMVNDCDPSCAEGKKFEFPVKVTLSGREPCGHGITIYTKMTTTFPKGSDGLQPKSVEEEFPCPLQQSSQ